MSTTLRSFLFSGLVLPAVLGAALPAYAQAQTSGPSLDPTKARPVTDPPTVVSGTSRTRYNHGYGGGYWGGCFYPCYPYYGGGYYGGFYGPGSLTVIGGYPYGYGYGGVVTFPSYPYGYSLAPSFPSFTRSVPAYFTLPLNKAGDGRRTRVVIPGEEQSGKPAPSRSQSEGDFYLTRPRSGEPAGADALGGRLRVQKAEGDLYLVEWTGPADTHGVTFRALGADEKVISRKELTSAPFRGLLSVPERTRVVELEVRSQDGITASLRLPLERFRAMDLSTRTAPAKGGPAATPPNSGPAAPAK